MPSKLKKDKAGYQSSRFHSVPKATVIIIIIINYRAPKHSTGSETDTLSVEQNRSPQVNPSYSQLIYEARGEKTVSSTCSAGKTGHRIKGR